MSTTCGLQAGQAVVDAASNPSGGNIAGLGVGLGAGVGLGGAMGSQFAQGMYQQPTKSCVKCGDISSFKHFLSKLRCKSSNHSSRHLKPSKRRRFVPSAAPRSQPTQSSALIAARQPLNLPRTRHVRSVEQLSMRLQSSVPTAVRSFRRSLKSVVLSKMRSTDA